MDFIPLSLLLLFVSFVSAQNGPTAWTATPFNPPSFPLAVKTPYLNVWDPQGDGPLPMSNSLPKVGSTFFSSMGWFTIISVDGVPFRLSGIVTPGPAINEASQVAVLLTPTRTSILFEAGPVTVNVTYLSPVEPNDIVQQSLPFSYYYLTITSNSTHAIKVFSDITGEWMSGDTTLQSNWSATTDASVVYLQTQLTSPIPYQELNDRPMDGTAYISMLQRPGLTWQIANSNDMCAQYATEAVLNNTVDPTFHPVGNPFDGLAIAVDLGNILSTSEPIVWAVGVMRDPVVQFTNSNGQLEERSSYYWSNYSDVHDAILGVLNNFNQSLENAISLDNTILHDASQVSTGYYDLLALSTRQAMGALDFTIVRDGSGAWNTSDVKAFLRGAGGIGSGGVNGVDVIYAASPIYLYLNPDILGYLLRPLLEYQESHLYPNPYAAIDIGTNYSKAIGNNEAHNEGIEQSGNMLILTYAHAQRTGDTSLISQHYNLLRNWTDYLVENALSPGSQRTSASDGISAVNQTNLALKGVLGIGAMAKISSAVGQTDDANHFQSVATDYADQWQTLSLSSDQSHIVAQYGQDDSYSLLYNLFAHKLLQLDLLPDSIFVNQSSFYESLLSSFEFGLPLGSSNLETSRTDWMMFAAAAASDNVLRDGAITRLHAYASPNLENQPFEVVYNPLSGHQITGSASPAQGAMFALLANQAPIKLSPGTSSNGTNGTNNNGKQVNKPAVIGGTIAGVIILSTLAAGISIAVRRRRSSDRVSIGHAALADVLIEPFDVSTLSGTGYTESRTVLYPHLAVQMSIEPSSPATQTLSPSSPNFIPQGGALYEKQALDRQFTNQGVAVPPNPPPVVDDSRRGSDLLTLGTNSGPQPNDPDLRRELDDLRREVTLMRQERTLLDEAPPVYDPDLENSLRGRAI